MRKPILTAILVAVLCTCFSMSYASIPQADSLFVVAADYQKCKSVLEKELKACNSDKEKAEIHWRLARVYLVLGEKQSTKQAKSEVFLKGLAMAESAIKEDPKNPAGYMWHCACVGRECQTHSLMEQARSVPKMMGDLETILDKLGRIDYSEAWQALAEIYYNHPFKSNDAAINYMRQACRTIPKGEDRPSTPEFLAKLLLERGWSPEKRRSASRAAKSKWETASSNIEKYTYFDGAPGIVNTAMSDKQEAESLLKH